MPQVLDVVNVKNEKVGEISLPEDIFGAPVKEHLLHQVVVMQRSRRRRGTASTKGRSEVRGGGRKPWRQKGTGRARAGTIRSPLWRGGGITFGPKPRDYSFSVPKAVRRAALKAALSAKAVAQEIMVLDNLELEKPSTKAFKGILSALGVEGKTLLVLPGRDETVSRSTANLATIKVLPTAGLNVYDLLWSDKVIFTREALASVEKMLYS
ncbi:MAG: 50S ribosomal protein L4 [candidate division NC10 bacterium]|nr:50S ribosomal protein L4 [candidate division NC10 bacterium]